MDIAFTIVPGLASMGLVGPEYAGSYATTGTAVFISL